MLSPKRTKFRKQHRGRMRGKAFRNNKISFGDYALQSQECGWITSRQIEATRRTITRAMKRLLNQEWVPVKVQLTIG
jgi:large subunit ribosomal protein L16